MWIQRMIDVVDLFAVWQRATCYDSCLVVCLISSEQLSKIGSPTFDMLLK